MEGSRNVGETPPSPERNQVHWLGSKLRQAITWTHDYSSLLAYFASPGPNEVTLTVLKPI